MAVYDYFWKVWLRLNLLTKDVDNDYMAEVSTVKNTFQPEDIVKAMVEAGNEVSQDTILSIVNAYNRMVRVKVQQGYSVNTGNVQLTPRVGGSWIDGMKDKFDPARHKLTLDAVLTDEMRQALAKVGVEVLGVKDSGAGIYAVTDDATGLTDGTITTGDTISIAGDKIKVANAEGVEGTGVFFVNSEGVATKVEDRIRRNDPKSVQVRVPGLADGSYTLRIVTQFTSGAVLLKEPRTIEYDKPLIVSGGGEERPGEL